MQVEVVFKEAHAVTILIKLPIMVNTSHTRRSAGSRLAMCAPPSDDGPEKKLVIASTQFFCQVNYPAKLSLGIYRYTRCCCMRKTFAARLWTRHFPFSFPSPTRFTSSPSSSSHWSFSAPIHTYKMSEITHPTIKGTFFPFCLHQQEELSCPATAAYDGGAMKLSQREPLTRKKGFALHVPC